MAGNRSLQAANKAKKDEFYTQLSDIENELRHYSEHFRGKTVLCNCDDPRVSNFFLSLDFSALHHEVNSLSEGAAAPSVSLPSRQEGVSVAGFSAASPSCGKSWYLALRYLLLFSVMRQPFPEIRWSNGKYCSASKLQDLGLQGVMIEVCAFGLVAAARKAHLIFVIA